jgi:hypothetical protein
LLHAQLTRVSPGRPEATLAAVTIHPRTTRRFDGDPDHARFDAHITTGPTDERDEQHVYVPEWQADRPGIDLLERVLTLARVQREEKARGVETVVLSADFAAYLVGLAREHIGECGSRPDPDHTGELQQLEQVLESVARVT